jgi:eukaryotic-like serine/threonine-protein kinase
LDLPVRSGKYELVAHLATGGMAEVFLARAFGVEGFERRVVIKRILPALSRDPRFVAMFVREARLGAGLSHPNIVQVHELGRWPSTAGSAGGSGELFIAMEYIHGKDLTRVNRVARAQGMQVPVALAVYITIQVLRGLHHAHSARDHDGRMTAVVHRDVSPHNVLIGHQGDVKLVDFGIARLAGGAADVDEGGPLRGGKFAYMSPEQAAGQDVDGRSDVYSAGICLYEMLAGHRLFQDPDPAEKLRRVLAAEVPDPRPARTEIPDRLWELMQGMLALDPSGRPTAQLAETQLSEVRHALPERADAHELAALMATLFPEEGAALGPDVAYHRIEADLELAQPREGSSSGLTWGAAEPAPPFHGPSGERKTVVVLAGEIIGFTLVSEHLEPQALVAQHIRLLRRLHAAVARAGGTFDRYQDDQFVVFFGIPATHEDDVERAIDTARRLIEVGRRMRPIPVQLALGVHRGEVTLGRGGQRGVRYLARGVTMKLARRLCQACDPGQVLVSEEVSALVGDRYRFGVAERLVLKGARDAHRSFVLKGRRRREPALGRRWVPRGAELETLRDTLARLERGLGSVTYIRGPVGVGKSCLLGEVRAMARKRGIPTYVGIARPAHRGTGGAALRELLSAALGVDAGAVVEGVRASEDALAALDGLSLPEEALGVVRRLFEPGAVAWPDSGSTRRAAATLLRHLAAAGPMLLAVDDSNHLDRAEAALVSGVLELAHELPIAFVVVGRDAGQGVGEGTAIHIALDWLAADLHLPLLCELTGASEADPPVVALLAGLAEGCPLYMAELVASMWKAERLRRERGRLFLADADAELPLPAALAVLISARIDALGAGGKAALQLLSVVGQRVDGSLFRAATRDDAALQSQLVASRLVVEVPSRGEIGFGSRLVREVLSRSLMESQRSELHLAVARLMEAANPDPTPAQLMERAHHLSLGGERSSAAAVAMQAGDLLWERALVRDAALVWEQALAWVAPGASEATGPGVATQEAELRWKAGRARLWEGSTARAERHLHVGLDLAADQGDDELLARCLLDLGVALGRRGRLPLARVHLEHAVNAVPDAGDAPPWAGRLAVAALCELGAIQRPIHASPDVEHPWSRAHRLAREDSTSQAICRVAGRADDMPEVTVAGAALLLRQAGEWHYAARADGLGLVARLGPDDSFGVLRARLEELDARGQAAAALELSLLAASQMLRLGDASGAALAFALAREQASAADARSLELQAMLGELRACRALGESSPPDLVAAVLACDPAIVLQAGDIAAQDVSELRSSAGSGA